MAAALAGIIVFVGIAAADLVATRYGDASLPWPPLVLPALVGAVVGSLGWILAGARWRSWGYEITDEWIAAKWGIFHHRVATVPRNRVQTVTTVDGPIDRALNLSSLNVHTAGLASPNLHIPHLEDETVAFLRSQLGAGAQVASNQ